MLGNIFFNDDLLLMKQFNESLTFVEFPNTKYMINLLRNTIRFWSVTVVKNLNCCGKFNINLMIPHYMLFKIYKYIFCM